MATESVGCNIHLIEIKSGTNSKQWLIHSIDQSNQPSIIVKGTPHGWVHPPISPQASQLRNHSWDLFLVTNVDWKLPSEAETKIAAHITIGVHIPASQYGQLQANISQSPQPNAETPRLPEDWKDGAIQPSSITERQRSGRPGELKLDRSMADYLSTALPQRVRNQPVSLFNLFKYPNGDSSVHDAYMEGFKEKFGSAAGARVKFMGPVSGPVDYTAGINTQSSERDGQFWLDANLVQYDSIWHYAYMLSTDIYQQLNQQKMQGLEDTCILCVSEIELW
jgi:hypothetical protein